MHISDIDNIKKAFKSKIDWTADDTIHITTATIPGLLDLTRVKAPEAMKGEFELFFDNIKDEKMLETLELIGTAITSGEKSNIVLYATYRKSWPKCITTVADIYVQSKSSWFKYFRKNRE